MDFEQVAQFCTNRENMYTLSSLPSVLFAACCMDMNTNTLRSTIDERQSRTIGGTSSDEVVFSQTFPLLDIGFIREARLRMTGIEEFFTRS